MGVGLFSTIGFVTFTGVANSWFEIIRSTLYESVAGSRKAFSSTWPISEAYLSADGTIKETLFAVRYVTVFAHHDWC